MVQYSAVHCCSYYRCYTTLLWQPRITALSLRGTKHAIHPSKDLPDKGSSRQWVTNARATGNGQSSTSMISVESTAPSALLTNRIYSIDRTGCGQAIADCAVTFGARLLSTSAAVLSNPGRVLLGILADPEGARCRQTPFLTSRVISIHTPLLHLDQSTINITVVSCERIRGLSASGHYFDTQFATRRE